MRERVDPSLVLSAAAIAGAVAVVRPGPVAAALAVVLLASRLRGARAIGRIAFLAAIVAALSAHRAAGALARDSDGWSRVRAHVPRAERCAIEGRVVSMPTVRGALAADVELETITCDSRAPPLTGLRARVYDLPADVARGDRVEAIAQLAPSRRTMVPDLGDPRPAWARRAHVLSGGAVVASVRARGSGVLATIDRARGRLRRGIAVAFAADVAPIARAMVLGEEDLAEGDDEAFRRSGLTHLLAVSGSHVALVVGGLVWLLQTAFVRVTWLARRVSPARLAAAIGVPLALVYEQVAGDSGSARRATAMALVLLLVRAAARRPDLPRTIGVSILVSVAVDPLAPFDLSFALSIAATVGLVTLGPAVDRVLPGKLPKMLRQAAAATVAASIACAPLVAGIAASLPALGVLANLVAVPIGELAALPLCNLAALLGATVGGWPADWTGAAASGALVLLRAVARVAAAPSAAVVAVPPPTAWQLATLIAAAAAAYLLPRRAWLVLAAITGALLSLLEIAHVRASRPHGLLRVTVLDVGQGDATLVDLPDGSALLVDAGGEVGSAWDPGRAVVAPVLAMRRRRSLALAVLSHPHPDHFLGLPRAIAATDVGAFWHNGEAHREGPLAALFERFDAKRVPLVVPACGAHVVGGAVVQVLHPCPRAEPDRGANDNSLVLRITHGARSVLLVGDAEHEAEHAMISAGVDLRADFLKVGHHGSRTSSSDAFLAAVRPAHAAISCGARNRFGHPHDPALARLSAAGIQVLRTDLEGAIRFSTDGRDVEVATARQGW
ncbi:MAG: DNA internalization-related competence protein ComEC/Rec2 [Deltaproteobacteria bacterium]|nr:DNA internalization-related competence protein ComEC/Rec2 [Deltaproteobacteria bacterium]